MNLNKISFYTGMGLWAAIFFTNQASNTKGQWMLVLGLILVIPFVTDEISKLILKRSSRKCIVKYQK